MPKRFRSLQADRVVETAERLERRIAERFPNANLRQVANELVTMAREATDRAQRIARPNVPLRALQWLLMGCCLALVGWFVREAQLLELRKLAMEFTEFVQTVDSSLASLVYIGAAVLFVMSWELRLKRRKALIALHELRSMAHIVDMHQLTKDPERLLTGGPATPSSPQRTMSPFELGRYLDYCSELLSMISKTAAIYVQEFPDSVALDAVNEITSLTNGLSRSIWQKIMLLDRMQGEEAKNAPAPQPPIPKEVSPTTLPSK
ncbi:MAG TPA: hypothetical protein VK137_20930 [Planctomycetaceae bacterium]|nr:hypothetical protein [Planctomycetaceae bacterium]